MAYYLHHNVTFKNRLTEHIRVELYKKDVEPDAVTNLKAIKLRQSYPKGTGDKFSNIIACEAQLELWLKSGEGFEFYDFIVTYPDEWKMIVYSDEQIVFIGFLTPGEGTAEFQNLPYSITLNAIDGLGLLKGEPLTDLNGDRFENVNLLIDYIVAILKKTNLDLDIRAYSSWIESSMTGRLTDSDKDTFNQTALHARTFLSDALTFYNCYDALVRLCDKYFQVYQWNGRWVILNIGEMQTNPGPRLWYTEYDSDGNVTTSAQADENPCPVGIDKIIHPRDRTHIIGSEFAVKSVRTEFNYTPWPELPTNNKFDRGTLSFPLGGPGFEAYIVDDWIYGKFSSGQQGFPFNPTADNAYRKSYIDSFGIETSREIVLLNTSGTQSYFLSDQIPVNQYDKMSMTLDFRHALGTVNFGLKGIFRVYLYPTGATNNPYWLDNLGHWRTGAVASYNYTYANGENSAEFRTFTTEPDAFPEDGTLYILFIHTGNSGDDHIYRNFSFTYLPFLAGGYRQVTGDYWFTSQNNTLKDTVEDEVYLSDSQKRVLKGSLYRSDLTTLTTPTWHRDNIEEERHFKELGNLARYNHHYRRMWKTKGMFSGLKWQPSDDTQLFEPLSFHRHFFFPDKAILGGKYFMLVPPLTINHDSGIFDGTFIEAMDSNATSEGAQTAGQIAFDLIQEINDTFSGLTFAQAHADPDKLIVYTLDANSVSAAANDNGVGNSPSLTITSTINLPGPTKQITIQVGADIQPTNSFTVTIAGTPATVVATSTVIYEEGSQTGDTHEFKYKFS